MSKVYSSGMPEGGMPEGGVPEGMSEGPQVEEID